MSYTFISPKYQVSQCPTDNGMGILGPDQPWTQATAGKEIAPTTNPCREGWKTIKGGTLPPHNVFQQRDEDCFLTGKVIEAQKPGYRRVQMWCCPPKELLPPREYTALEDQEYGGECQPFYHDGEEYPARPVWVDARFPTPTGWSFRETPIRSRGYKLVCKAIRGKVEFKLDPTMIMGQARTTVQQAEEMLREKQARMEERETIIQAAEEEFQYGFFQRYGVYMLAGAGVIGLGVVAGLIKKAMD